MQCQRPVSYQSVTAVTIVMPVDVCVCGAWACVLSMHIVTHASPNPLHRHPYMHMAQVVRGIAPPGLQRRAHHLGGMSAPEASCCSSPAEGWGSGKGGKDAGQGVSHGRTHVASDSQYA
uniref:Uncharacterized protein n=1 Tax=Haptolina ericina TaxID=156174 RepID=A0A7S3AMT5_9EUKA